jgi:hypothetical protein
MRAGSFLCGKNGASPKSAANSGLPVAAKAQPKTRGRESWLLYPVEPVATLGTMGEIGVFAGVLVLQTTNGVERLPPKAAPRKTL